MMRLLFNSNYSRQQKLFRHIVFSFQEIMATINKTLLSTIQTRDYTITELITSYLEQTQRDFWSFFLHNAIYSQPSKYFVHY